MTDPSQDPEPAQRREVLKQPLLARSVVIRGDGEQAVGALGDCRPRELQRVRRARRADAGQHRHPLARCLDHDADDPRLLGRGHGRRLPGGAAGDQARDAAAQLRLAQRTQGRLVDGRHWRRPRQLVAGAHRGTKGRVDAGKRRVSHLSLRVRPVAAGRVISSCSACAPLWRACAWPSHAACRRWRAAPSGASPPAAYPRRS